MKKKVLFLLIFGLVSLLIRFATPDWIFAASELELKNHFPNFYAIIFVFSRLFSHGYLFIFTLFFVTLIYYIRVQLKNFLNVNTILLIVFVFCSFSAFFNITFYPILVFPDFSVDYVDSSGKKSQLIKTVEIKNKKGELVNIMDITHPHEIHHFLYLKSLVSDKTF